MSNTEITIHTDGSCLNNPGPGGWAAAVRRYTDDQEIKKALLSGRSPKTTNNRMEMTAALRGLGKIKRDEKAQITVFSDSQLLVRGMTEWLPNWQKNGWRNSSGKPVENRDLWEALVATCAGLNVRWTWVRGHDGDARNEEVDAIAFAAANGRA
ncbi:ribonuclease HI [Roseovarius azorensis]|uniref:Ribonuclease H n=1 Tax=Roseovarius azorensis TaxID=1287727 RepID=A0A1H7XJC9_9RHOB|nr:ribonuclease HI [Roseovarius azorensis]SEM33763.1 ribonuclease HI [Roseovarius azorensis]